MKTWYAVMLDASVDNSPRLKPGGVVNLNGFFADVLQDAETRDGPADEIIAKYNAIPYMPK